MTHYLMNDEENGGICARCGLSVTGGRKFDLVRDWLWSAETKLGELRSPESRRQLSPVELRARRSPELVS